MAIAGLSKLSVPVPQSNQSQGLLMPKLKYRFRVIFENFGVTKPTSELTKQVVSAGRPQVTFDQVELHVYNSRVKYAGKHTWEDVSIVLRDDATNQVMKLVGEQLQKQFDFFEQSSASSGIDYKFTTKIEILDGSNGGNYQGDQSVLESFSLYGCYLKQAQYQQADYSSSDPMDITLSIAYDNALQAGRGGSRVGIGAEVARTVRTLATG
jgi:hypothetical protein